MDTDIKSEFVVIRFSLAKTSEYPELHYGMHWRECAHWEQKMRDYCPHARLYNMLRLKDGNIEMDWLCPRAHAYQIKTYVPDETKDHVQVESVTELEMDKVQYSPAFTRQLLALFPLAKAR